MKSILRQAKNTVMQFSDIECKVREATSNDSWGASTSQMAEIAKATNNYQDYPQLFAMLWKRLNDVEHIMHVQKALILVEYLLRNGADRFINDAKRRARDIAQLKKYKHYDANNQDDAKEARAKAKIVYDMLMDDAKLQEERAKALKIKDVRLTGFGSDDVSTRYGGQGGDSYGNDSSYGRGSGDYSYGNGNGSTGTVAAAPARRRKDTEDEGDPFDDDAPTPATKKGAAKDKTAAATTPDGEPVKKKKKKKVPAADPEATESTPEPTKLEAPAADGKKKKKKKKAVVEEKEENSGDDFANPFDNGHSNGQASHAYSAAANPSSFVDEFASAIPPITYQQQQQDIDILTGRAPISLQTSGDLVDIFSSPTPASPMNQQKLEQIAQQPFDPLGRDPNYRPSPEQKAIEGPKDLWAVTDLMNLNDITKSTAKPAKKIAATGPTMAELRAKQPGSTDASFSNIGFNNTAAAPPMQTPPFQPPMYPNAAPMGYPPLHQQMAGMNMGYPPQPYGYGGMMPAGYQQPMLALMPPSAYQTGPPALMPPTSSGPSGHADLPFAVTPGSRPIPAYNSSKPVIFDVPSAQQVAQAKVDPHYNYNTQQRVTQRPTSNLASNW